MKSEKNIGSIIVTAYSTFDNKTVDIVQDKDKIVLSHRDALLLANHILNTLPKLLTT